MLRLPARLSKVNSLAFSPDGRHLLAVGLRSGVGGLFRFSRVALYDLADPSAEPPPRIDTGLDPVVGYFLPDGRLLGIDNRGSWLAVRPDGTAADRHAATGHRNRLDPAAVSPDGRWLALMGRGVGEVLCRPLGPDPGPGWRAELDEREEAVAVAFSPGAEAVAAAVSGWPWRDGAWGVRVYAADSGQFLAWADTPAHTLRLAWSPDGRFLVAVAPDGFRAIDPYPWAAAADRRAAGGRLTAAAFHPSGRAFLTADDAGRVQEWDVSEWEGADDPDRPPDRAFDWGVGPVSAVAVSPDGSLGAAAGRGGEVVVWDF